MDAQSPFLGCLVGLAVGDALGTTVEFTKPGTFAPVTDMVGGGPFGLAPGQWTDDTSMALCLADSLLEQDGFDAEDQMRRYVWWWRTGYRSSRPGRCFDIGNTVAAALATFERSGNPFSGSTDPASAGNGSLMRLAPVSMFYANRPAEAIEKAAESSRTTHGALEAVDACRYVAGLIVGALRGESKDALLSSVFDPGVGTWQKKPLAPSVRAIASRPQRGRPAREIQASGYVMHTLDATLWAFANSESFREGALLAVNLGEDADTTGAVYGQLAGAFYGIEGIPAEWRAQLHDGEGIADVARRLLMSARCVQD